MTVPYRLSFPMIVPKKGKDSMNPLEDPIRLLLSKAIRRCGKGWASVSSELSAAVGTKITESMLHEFTRARRFRGGDIDERGSKKLFPMEWFPALAAITGSHELEQYALCQECRKALAIGKIGSKAMSQYSR
jgi:hypothetical protein